LLKKEKQRGQRRERERVEEKAELQQPGTSFLAMDAGTACVLFAADEQPDGATAACHGTEDMMGADARADLQMP
jgi:hypothetical protein